MYLVFGYHDYYPSGGWNDFLYKCTSFEAAKDFVAVHSKQRSLDVYEIVDFDTISTVETLYKKRGSYVSGI